MFSDYFTATAFPPLFFFFLFLLFFLFFFLVVLAYPVEMSCAVAACWLVETFVEPFYFEFAPF